MRVVFMGTPGFAVPSLERLVADEFAPVAVYTQPDRPAGRGRMPKMSPVKALAVDRGIPVFQPEALKDEAEIDRLAGLQPDVIVVVAYGQILPPRVLGLPGFGCLNIHPSLLPKYRGASPVASAILSGEDVTGVTVMLLDEGMDTGPTLMQRILSIAADDTTASLEARLAGAGADLLLEAMPLWFAGRLEPQPQQESEATYCRQISKVDGQIDWKLPAEELERRVRAFNPWPTCYTFWRGKMLRILEAKAVSSEGKDVPGTVVAPMDTGITVGVAAGDGTLALDRVQLEGKKAMSVAEFLRGQPAFVGECLG